MNHWPLRDAAVDLGTRGRAPVSRLLNAPAFSGRQPYGRMYTSRKMETGPLGFRNHQELDDGVAEARQERSSLREDS